MSVCCGKAGLMDHWLPIPHGNWHPFILIFSAEFFILVFPLSLCPALVPFSHGPLEIFSKVLEQTTEYPHQVKSSCTGFVCFFFLNKSLCTQKQHKKKLEKKKDLPENIFVLSTRQKSWTPSSGNHVFILIHTHATDFSVPAHIFS